MLGKILPQATNHVKGWDNFENEEWKAKKGTRLCVMHEAFSICNIPRTYVVVLVADNIMREVHTIPITGWQHINEYDAWASCTT